LIPDGGSGWNQTEKGILPGKEMDITVKGYASMKKYLAGLPADGALDIPEGSPAGAVLKQLGVPPEMKKVILVNGRHCSQRCVLRAGDILVFFPPLEGG
jgi:hypothetical protein